MYTCGLEWEAGPEEGLAKGTMHIRGPWKLTELITLSLLHTEGFLGCKMVVSTMGSVVYPRQECSLKRVAVCGPRVTIYRTCVDTDVSRALETAPIGKMSTCASDDGFLFIPLMYDWYMPRANS